MVYPPIAYNLIRKYCLKAFRWCLLPVLILGMTGAANPSLKPIRVAFIDPQPNSPFWISFSKIMVDAAQEFGIKLDRYNGFEWPTQTEAMLRNILKGPQRPDYLVITIHQGARTQLLKLAEQYKVPVFVVDSGLLQADRKRYGGPRQYFKYWIGQMLPDNEKAGYDLANVLADETLKMGLPIEMVALEGIPIEYAAIERLKGLKRATSQRKDIHLRQVIRANWSFARAQAITPLIVKRYPHLTTIWTAGDTMALGTIKPLRELGLRPGKQIAIGGIDWNQEAFAAIKRGELNASVGGHVFFGGWVMTLLYDYHHGHDFASQSLSWYPKMATVTKNNVDLYSPLLPGKGNQEIDFRKFSRVLNPGLKSYDFSLSKLTSCKRRP